MTKEQLRVECLRLFASKTISDSKQVLDIYSEFLFKTIQNHHDDKVYSEAENDAKVIIQMIFSKALHIKNLIAGVTYTSKDGSTLRKIIDPTAVAILIRNIYETVGMFNLIYRNTKSKEEREILYLLWVHSGLKYRQKFESVITTDESKEKYENEKVVLAKISNEIEDNALFISLNKKDQEKIRIKLEKKEYLMRFEGKEVVFLVWHDLVSVMGFDKDFLFNIYAYFSQYSHPTNVSVFQFADMFRRGEEKFADLVNFNLKIAFCMFSAFIADYICLFPKVLETFESLELRDQIVINYFNTFLRNKDYSINDSIQTLE